MHVISTNQYVCFIRLHVQCNTPSIVSTEQEEPHEQEQAEKDADE